jgi:hypothetical protein
MSPCFCLLLKVVLWIKFFQTHRVHFYFGKCCVSVHHFAYIFIVTIELHFVTNQLSVCLVTGRTVRCQDRLPFLNTRGHSSGMPASNCGDTRTSQGSQEINFECFNFATRYLFSSDSVPDAWSCSNTKTVGSFPCITCGRQYRRLKALMAHVKYECGKAPQFQCSYCYHRFTQNSSLRAHIRRKHPSFWNDGKSESVTNINIEF